MELKRILVPFGGRSNDVKALRVALALAKTQRAHVEVWHVSPDPVEVVTRNICFTPFVDRAVCDTTVKLLKQTDFERTEKARKLLGRAADFMGVSQVPPGDYPDGASASFHTAVGNPERIISERGRLCDLTIMCPHASARFSQMLLSIMFDTGRPVLIIPRKKTGREINDRIIVAWNGSREAAHAVSFAMPMLEKGKVWVVAQDSDSTLQTSESELVAYLRQHHVEVEAMPLDVKASSLGETILGAGKAVDAGLIVMGAYGHSRAREMILGGVTDFMLKNADVPVLLAH